MTYNSVNVYLREIGRTQLLNPDEEITLARQIQDLVKLEAKRAQLQDRIDREPTDAECAAAYNIDVFELKRRLHKSRIAKDKMVQANLP